jgi:AcrR family transcriptional regulator
MRGVTARRHVGRPRGGDPVETRRVILGAAEECFAASGFAGATTRQVAALAGVNVATLHYHFGSKAKLYRAVLDAAFRAEVPLPERDGTPQERLAAAVESLWAFGAAHPSLPRLSLLHRLAGPAAAGRFEQPEDPRASLLVRALTETGVPTSLPPAETARVILALLDGALVAAQNGGGPEAPSPPAVVDASRAGVVAAALRVAGF